MDIVEEQAALRRVVDRVNRIPARYRIFRTSYERARRFHRLPAPVLDRLLELGLPHGDGPHTGPMFDQDDLKSASIILGLRSPPAHAPFQAVANALLATESAHEGRYAMRIEASCPYDAHDGECRFALAPAVRHSPAVSRVQVTGSRVFELDLRLGSAGPRYLTFTEAQQRLLAEMSRLEFHVIPSALNTDLGFLAETGLADCTLATRFLVARGAELEAGVRAATGLCLTRPFASRHYWVELRQQGRWRAADPFFLTTLTRVGLIDGDAWPPHRSPAGAYWRLDLAPGELVLDHQRVGGEQERARVRERLGPAVFAVR